MIYRGVCCAVRLWISFGPAHRVDAQNWMISVRRASIGSTAGAVNNRRSEFLPERWKRLRAMVDKVERTVSEYEAYAKVSLKKYKPTAARNEDKNVPSGLL